MKAMQSGQAVIDCDIHTAIPNAQALSPYLSEHWNEYIRTSAFKGAVDTAYPPNAPTTRGAADLEAVRRDVLEPWHVERGILNCSYAIDSLHNPDTAAAMAAAVNDWLAAEWLDKEPRLRASMVVPTRVPEMGAREIDRLGDHPGFVQVLLPAFIVIALGLDPTRTLVISQVILSFCLPAALIPLIVFTSRRELMGGLVNRPTTTALAALIGGLIVALNLLLVYRTLTGAS